MDPVTDRATRGSIDTMHPLWLTLPQVCDLLDMDRTQALAWADKNGITQRITGNPSTADRNRAYRFDLDSINTTARTKYPQRVTISTGQAAHLLGISRRTLQEHVQAGKVTPTARVGKQDKALFRLSDITPTETIKETTP